MLRITSLLLLTAAASYSATMEFLSYDAWLQGATSTPATVLSIDNLNNNQFNLPGFTFANCRYDPSPSRTVPNGCSSTLLLPGSFVNGEWTSAVGHIADNIVTGQDAAYVASQFSYGNDTYAVGFDIAAEPLNLTSMYFQINGLAGEQFFPFGGGNPVTGPIGNSSEYSGFLGFVSDTPIESVYVDAYGTGAAYQIDNMYADEAVPEPGTWTAAIGLLAIAVIMWRRRLRLI